MGKRGEVGIPPDPAKGLVWSSIVQGWAQPGFENEFVSVAELDRGVLAKHPWSLGGGGAAELKDLLQERQTQPLAEAVEIIGFGAVTRADEVFELPLGMAHRLSIPSAHVAIYGFGEAIRDWSLYHSSDIVFPYTDTGTAQPKNLGRWPELAWRYRTQLWDRQGKGFKTKKDSGGAYYEYSMFYPRRHFCPFKISFAFVATHNHFILDRGGRVFNRSAPVITLPPGSSEDDHLILLGLLNSSTACFWMKQIFHCKGIRGQGGGITATDWEQFFEFDSTKLKLFPVPAQKERILRHALVLDKLAQARTAYSISSVLASKEDWNDARSLRSALDVHAKRDTDHLLRMVALQEELDWLVYELYGLDKGGEPTAVEQVVPLSPSWLPWALNLATRDAEIRATLSRGEDPEELPTVWFERHGWEPLTELPREIPKTLRVRIEARRQRIAANQALALIEAPNFKRRWYRPDYPAEEKQALELWLAERIEAVAKERGRPLPLDQLVAKLQDDPRTLAVCEVLTTRRDFSLSALVADTLSDESVPNHPLHIYKHSGLVKRSAWERMWEEQRREDAGETAKPEVPQGYVTGDFLKVEYWQLRGKLDVPKERFIGFTEVPGRTGADTLYGWAGWTPLQRLKALLAIDEDLEDTGTPLADRIGLLDSAWRLLPDVARDDPSAAARLKAELQALVGPTGPSPENLEDWRKRFPPPKPPKKKAERARKAARAEEDDAP